MHGSHGESQDHIHCCWKGKGRKGKEREGKGRKGKEMKGKERESGEPLFMACKMKKARN